MAALCARKSFELNMSLTPVLVSMRKELGLPIEETVLLDLMPNLDETTDQVNKFMSDVNDQIKEELTDSSEEG